MNIKPILFNTEMVRAILDSRKVETRRVVKPQPTVPCEIRLREEGPLRGKWQMYREDPTAVKDASGPWSWAFEPPFHVGDVLWVRETWGYAADLFDQFEGIIYRADYTDADLADAKAKHYKWRPSIRMPREAARLFLRVKNVRAERLQDIDDAGVVAEGLEIGDAFDEVWESTLKPLDRGKYGWAADPFVWVISFQRCSRPDGRPTEIAGCEKGPYVRESSCSLENSKQSKYLRTEEGGQHG